MLMGFLQSVKNSIYSPNFYEKLLTKSLGRSFLYFFLLIFLFTAFRTGPIIYSFAKEGQPEIEKMLSGIVDHFPANLEVKIQKGLVTTNAQEPYFIPFPSSSESEDFENLIVIDTKNPFSVDQFDKYSTIAWLSRDSIYVKGSGSEFRAYALSDIEDLTINRDAALNLKTALTPWLAALTPIVGFFAFVAIFVGYSFRLIYLFFLALCIFLIAKLMNKPLLYSQSYKIGMHAMTLGFFVEILQHFIGLNSIPFLFTLVALAVFYINFQKIDINTKTLKSRH